MAELGSTGLRPYSLPGVRYTAPRTQTFQPTEIVPDTSAAAGLLGNAATMNMAAETIKNLPEMLSKAQSMGRKEAQQREVADLKMEKLKEARRTGNLEGFKFSGDDEAGYVYEDPALAKLKLETEKAKAASYYNKGQPKPVPSLFDAAEGNYGGGGYGGASAAAPAPGAPGTTSGTISTTPGAVPDTTQFVIGLEGFEPRAKSDRHQTSIGYGTRATGPNEVITEEAARQRLDQELGGHTRRIDEAANRLGIQLTPGQRTALISFDFNSGQGVTALERARGGDLSGTRAFMDSYIVKGPDAGQYYKGVRNRRDQELRMFDSSLSAAAQPQRPGFTAAPPAPDASDPNAPAAVAKVIAPPQDGGLMGALKNLAPGIVEQGNVPLDKPVIRPITIATPKGSALIPTIREDGTAMTDDEAKQHFNTTGRHLGIFKTPEAATSYAQLMQNSQAQAAEARTAEAAQAAARNAPPEPTTIGGRLGSKFAALMGLPPADTGAKRALAAAPMQPQGPAALAPQQAQGDIDNLPPVGPDAASSPMEAAAAAQRPAGPKFAPIVDPSRPDGIYFSDGTPAVRGARPPSTPIYSSNGGVFTHRFVQGPKGPIREEIKADPLQLDQDKRLVNELGLSPAQVHAMSPEQKTAAIQRLGNKTVNEAVQRKLVDNNYSPQEIAELMRGDQATLQAALKNDPKIPPALAKQLQDLGGVPYGKNAEEVANEINELRTKNGILTPQQVQNTNTLQTRMAGDKDYVDIQNIKNAYTTLMGVQHKPSAISDIAVVNSFQKIVDPGVSVREADVRLMESAQGIVEKIKTLPKKVTGEALISPAMRKQIFELSKDIYESKVGAYYDGKGKMWFDTAKAYNVPVNLIGLDFGIPLSSGRTAPGTTPTSAAAAAPPAPGTVRMTKTYPKDGKMVTTVQEIPEASVEKATQAGWSKAP